MYRFRKTFPAAAVVLLLAACADGPTATLTPVEPSLASSGPVLVECPVSTDTATTGTIDATGGAIQLDNHRLSLPAMAVLLPTQFELRAPVSNYMELTVRADGAESFNFREIVKITIDYSRCTRDNIDKAPLTVWQIDPVTKELLEHMGGEDNKITRTITFETDHLSTFSLAR